MKTHAGGPSPSASGPTHPKKPIEPKFPALAKMPDTALELFHSLATTAVTTVDQPDPKGDRRTRHHRYALPWAGFESWHDARARLSHFEANFRGTISWAPFNDSDANDGPMSLNAYPGRAFIERVTNEGDANLERKALEHTGPLPSSPAEAAGIWFPLGPDALALELDGKAARELAQKTVTVTGFVGDPRDHKDSIFDARDFGIGLTAAEMPHTILSLNRGNKKQKPWLTGKHGQGASSTYQYSDLTLIASRRLGSSTIAFTLVEAAWDSQNGSVAKTPTYRYMKLDGLIPEIVVPEKDFPVGTLVRHIGYNAVDLFDPIGENSLYSLLMRSLAKPLFPVWLEMYSLRPHREAGFPTFPGFRRYGRVIRGSVNALDRAWLNTLQAKPAIEEDAEETVPVNETDQASDDQDPKQKDVTRVLHRASEYFELPTWDYGGRVGVGELGRVRINYWVVEPSGRSSQHLLRNWVDPDKTILMTLDGQTHAEESRAIVTGQNGAKLWAVGRYTVVQIDCDELDPRARYELFTSTREHAKETPIKRLILEELVRRLGFDTKLQELNVQLAAADIRTSEDSGETISSMIRKYLKAMGISFDQLTRRVEKWIDLDETREVPASKPELLPIEAIEPPTFVRWKLKASSAKLYPDQRYSFVFETDASPAYWDPANQSISRIKVLAHGLRYVGAGEMKGGRVRCHFHCPADARVGSVGYVQVQLDYALGAAKTHRLPIDIVHKPSSKPVVPRPPKDDTTGDEKGSTKRVITVKIRKKDFTEVEIPVVKPIPVKRDEGTLWQSLGWPLDPGRAGFSIRSLGGRIQLYYNAEFPPFLDLRRRLSRKSLDAEFVKRYELKLVLHTIFTLNYDFVDEEDFTEVEKKRLRDLLCAAAESLAIAAKSELEIESRLKSEETAPIDAPPATGFGEAAVT